MFSEDPVLVVGFESGVDRLDELQVVSFLRFVSVVTMQDCWLPQMTKSGDKSLWTSKMVEVRVGLYSPKFRKGMRDKSNTNITL